MFLFFLKDRGKNIMDAVLAFVVILILILIIYSYSRKYAKDTFKTPYQRARNDIGNMIKYSSGGFDSAAQAAFNKTETLENKTLGDDFARAYILDKYIYRSEANNTPEIHAEIARQYKNIIERIHDDPRAARAELNDTQLYINIGDYDLADIVHEINNFNMDFGTFENTLQTEQMTNFARNVGTVMKIEDKLQSIKNANPKNRNEFVADYIEQSKHIKSDAQNVHDSALVQDLKNTLIETMADTTNIHEDGTREIDAEIMEVAQKMELPNQKIQSIRRALSAVRGGHIVKPYDQTEGEILNKMWNRAYNSDNMGRENNIKEALVNSLADCVENDSLVCPSGRAARMLNSLLGVDADARIGEAKTVDMYKAQIYNETQKIIDTNIELAKNSGDAEIKKYADSFGDPSMVFDKNIETQFKDTISNQIKKNIEQYRDKIGTETDKIIADCAFMVDMF